jgi:hypothetical protein
MSVNVYAMLVQAYFWWASISREKALSSKARDNTANGTEKARMMVELEAHKREKGVLSQEKSKALAEKAKYELALVNS